MKKIITFVALLSMTSLMEVSAQSYEHGLGIRGGATSGITYKQFLSDQDAMEFIAGFQGNGIRITGLYERHIPAFEVEGLYWYYGIGGHVGLYDNGYDPPYRDDDFNTGTALGVDGIGGLEYCFSEIPITLSADIKPFIEFTDPDIYLWDSGLSVRYTF